MSGDSPMWVQVSLTILAASIPLLLAGLGELITEKSGVLNLGIEGMMLAGAITGFAFMAKTGSAVIAVSAAAAAGMAMSLLFAFLALTLLSNQVATGLALTLFGIGLSALLGKPFVGAAIPALPKLSIPGLSDLPIVGPLLFHHDFLVYFALLSVPAAAYFLLRTRSGLILRAVGESHDAAHALGYPVIRIRYMAVLYGGAMSGLAGAFLSLSYTPMWAENMTAGRGWIALALVVFATWRTGRLLLGALLFGVVSILELHAQALGIQIPSQLLSMLPYLATIAVLTLISADSTRIRLLTPACIGKSFYPPS